MIKPGQTTQEMKTAFGSCVARCRSQFRLSCFEVRYSASLKLEHAYECAKKITTVYNASEILSCITAPPGVKRNHQPHSTPVLSLLILQGHRSGRKLLSVLRLVKLGEHVTSIAMRRQEGKLPNSNHSGNMYSNCSGVWLFCCGG